MPPKKFSWGDIPNLNEIKDKDKHGKWIHCKTCDVKIKVRCQFSLTEWRFHIDSIKHTELANSTALKDVPKITNFFTKKQVNKISLPQRACPPKKRKKIITCPGFYYGNNSELLSLYAKYKMEDQITPAIQIRCNNGVWSTFSIDCTGEKVIGRQSSRYDKTACDACFNYPSLSKLKFRIRRMDTVMRIEQFLMAPKSSLTGYIAVSKFVKSNTSLASPEILTLIKRCKHYQQHHKWMDDNIHKLKQYDVVDQNGKIHHEKWIMKLSKMYQDEPAMKDSLLHSLLKFTLSRYEGNINAPCSPKLIGFFQTLHAISPKFYRIFSQNFGGYNERTIRSFQATMSPKVPIIDCDKSSISNRAKEWINQLKEKNSDKTILVSAMVDATKVPGLGEYSQRYCAWVGGIFPKHFIKDKDFNQDDFVQTTLATEIKVGMLTSQEYSDGMSPFKIIAADQQSTNKLCNEYRSEI